MSLPEVPSLEDTSPMPEAIAEHCAAIECRGNFMFDPVRCLTTSHPTDVAAFVYECTRGFVK